MEAVVKIGGSLFNQDRIILSRLYRSIGRVSRKHGLVILFGGGELADSIKRMQSRLNFSDNVAHWAAIRAMDINSSVLSRFSKKFKLVDTISECKACLNSNLIPVFLVYDLLKKYDELPKSWKVTSDSIAVYVAHLLSITRVILVKDVDGIYGDSHRKYLIKEIASKKLSGFDKTDCIDDYLAQAVRKYQKSVYVISGFYPERIEKILENSATITTKILP